MRAAVVLALASCTPGPRVLDFGPAQTGHGVEGQLVVRGHRIKGELLEVSDTAFVMQTGDGVVLVPKFTIDELSFWGLDWYSARDLVGDVLEQHRLMSRFPAGIPPAALRALLAESHQSEIRVVVE
jgi:hypothetical protein